MLGCEFINGHYNILLCRAETLRNAHPFSSPWRETVCGMVYGLGIACVAVRTSRTRVRLSRALVRTVCRSLAMRGRWRAGCGSGVAAARARACVSAGL